MVAPLIALAAKAILPSLIQGAVGQLAQKGQEAQQGFQEALKGIIKQD